MPLMPLFMNNANNVGRFGPQDALTGPIERADAITVREHLDVISGKTEEVYRILSEELVSIAQKKNPGNDYDTIKKLIGEENR